MSEHGRVLAVNRVKLGSELIGDHADGATVLTIDDGSDFDEDGGWLSIGDQVIQYDSVDHNDDDTADVVLADPLDAAADDGDPVLLWDRSRDVQASEVYAEVELDGEKGGDTIKALVAHHLVDELPEGIRGLVGESVRMEEDGDDWIVVDVLGLSEAAGMHAEANDSYSLTADDIAAGSVTVQLSHSPIGESVKAFAGTVFQEPTNYTVNYDGATVTWPLAGWEPSGLRLAFHYWYVRGLAHVALPKPAVDPSYIGYTSFEATNSSTYTSVDLPTNSEDGDLLLLMVRGDSPSITDPRMTVIHDSGLWCLAYGYSTASTAPIAISTSGVFSAIVNLLAMRVPDGHLEVDPAHVIGPTTPSTSTSETLPNVPADLSGAVCMYMGTTGLGSINTDWTKSPDWQLVCRQDNSGQSRADMAYTDLSPLVDAPTPHDDENDTYQVMVLGLVVN